ncbi:MULTISPECIES: DUF6773 family protein [Pontibacillus]|uniref:Uncharacterized protein n=1 Tax=Pontibacillus chungwhensis TaxID=265426 RepID=A0ABY8V084_9BACI|nr:MULTISPECIES: DUF6773 family protein [Pontibacillus]MCD5324356.1 hypothetical protein [Pontibacillus sp. HN14]WIF99345.1 hypothetical protein QNI29_06725 [Pontibacillus chungwhensis]
MGLFNPGRVQDERVRNLQNQVYKEMYMVVLIVCGLSVALKVYQQGVVEANIGTELMIAIAGGAYYLIRASKLGIYSYEVETHDQKSRVSHDQKYLWGGILSGLLISSLFGIRSVIEYADSTGEGVLFFFLSLFGGLIIYLPLFLIIVSMPMLAKRKSDRTIEKQLEDEDDGDEM